MCMLLVTSANDSWRRSCIRSCLVCVCVFACVSVSRLSLKLGVMIGPTSRKNWSTFGGDPVPDTDSRSLFHFPCRIRHFGRFISSYCTVTGLCLRNFVKWLIPTRIWIHFVLGAIRQTPTYRSGSNSGSLLVEVSAKWWRWQRYAISEHILFCVLFSLTVSIELLLMCNFECFRTLSGHLILNS